jgi:hypothetical protein
MRKEYEESFRQIIKNGIADGGLKNIDSETMLFTTLTMLRSLYIWYPRQKQMDKDELKANMISVLLDGIRA